MHILILEDNPEIADLMEIFVMSSIRDSQIRIAHSLREARELLDKGFLPDLAICDGELPDGSGPSLFREIRIKSPNVFILFATSHASDMLDERFPGHDEDEFLGKPILPEALISFLRGFAAKYKK